MDPQKPLVLPMPQRKRQVPPRFSWVDQRLVRERYVERCGTPALALYLVLVTVADSDGVSYYGDRSLCRMLHWSGIELKGARHDLQAAGLIAYRRPFYQVLDLCPNAPIDSHRTDPVSRHREQPPERAATRDEVHALIEAWKQGGARA